jgi:hypothetical protein
MERLIILRPELASVCQYLPLKQRAPAMPVAARPAQSGILADLAAIRGAQ